MLVFLADQLRAIEIPDPIANSGIIVIPILRRARLDETQTIEYSPPTATARYRRSHPPRHVDVEATTLELLESPSVRPVAEISMLQAVVFERES